MNLLIENMSDARPVLVEAKDGFNLRFQFMEADRENLNKRTYPLPILSHAIEEAQERINTGASLYGSTDHQVKMRLDDVSHRLLKVEMKATEAWAEAAVLPTTKGKNLAVLIRAGGGVGVSARGLGAVEKGIVQEGYILQGVDCVLDPSFNASVSKANIFESESFGGEEVPEHVREGIWWATNEGNKIDEERRFELALKAGFKGSFKDYMDGLNAKGDDAKLTTLYAGALKAGFKGSYLEFRNSYLGRKQ